MELVARGGCDGDVCRSVNVPGLFFAGALGHGKDHLRAGGGFIHGIRYTARAVHRYLEARYHNPPGGWPAHQQFEGVAEWDHKSVGLGPNGCNRGDWNTAVFGGCDGSSEAVLLDTSGELDQLVGSDPREGGGGRSGEILNAEERGRNGTVGFLSDPASFGDGRNPGGFVPLIQKIFDRINAGSGLVPMQGLLGDGVVFRCPTPDAASTNRGMIVADYMEEMSAEYFNLRFEGLPRLW